MKEMIEICWHGRGGQGAVTAAKIVADSAVYDGKFVQAFPEFGAERAGAPVRSFNRISSKPIFIHSQIENPDAVVVLDPTLLDTVSVCDGLLDDGILLVNTTESPQDIRKRCGMTKARIYTVSATDIALRELKRNIPNTPMVAALVKITGILKLDTIIENFKKKYASKFRPEVIEANVRAMRAAADEVKAE
jgi:pyruvate ferredoxin oxidoreductase gamma subunit